MSNLYATPLSFTAGTVTLKAKALQADWTESATLSETYTFDDTPPTVRVETFPYPVNGWHSGPVTVTFTCEDTVGIASCPGPATVTAEGDTTVSGTATDLAGHQTPASVTVHLDTAPPEVALTNPTADLTTTDTSLTLTGTVSDGLSGLDLVQCNGEPATVDQGVASCTVPLRPGRNSVVLLARDAAGHVTSRGIRVTRTGTSTTLTLTPVTRTLLVEERAALSLLDDFGSPITAATWTSSDPAVVELSTDDPPMLTALASGTATITAAKNGLSATATITVVAGTSLPDGTTRWTVPATPGTTDRPPIYAHRVDEIVPDLFIIEATGEWAYDASYTVRATTGDGTVTWTEAAPGFPVFGDEDGGLVAGIGNDTANVITGLARFAGPTGAVPWRYTSTGELERTAWTWGGATRWDRPAVAQAADGTVYLAEKPNAFVAYPNIAQQDARVVALDGTTGAVRAGAWLPRSVRRGVTTGGQPYELPWANRVVGPIVGEDGAAYVAYTTHQRTDDKTYLPDSQTSAWTVSLVKLDATGATTTVPIWSFYCEGNQTTGRLDECTDGQVWSSGTVRRRPGRGRRGAGAVEPGGAGATPRRAVRLHLARQGDAGGGDDDDGVRSPEP